MMGEDGRQPPLATLQSPVVPRVREWIQFPGALPVIVTEVIYAATGHEGAITNVEVVVR